MELSFGIILCNTLSYGCVQLQLVFSIHKLHFACSARNELIFNERGFEMFFVFFFFSLIAVSLVLFLYEDSWIK